MECERYIVVLQSGFKPEHFKSKIKDCMRVVSVWKILPCVTILANVANIEQLEKYEEVKYILRSARD